MKQNLIFSYLIFILFLIANISFWFYARDIQTQWQNVPEAPSAHEASLMALGDKQLAYRVNAMTLQNFGEEGGRSIPLKEYDFKKLKNWFLMEDQLDPRSDSVPMMAAYYYGAVKDPQKVNEVLDYLAIVGQRPDGNKWRWLGQAVFLAQHEMKDPERALELAYLLADNKNPNVAPWAKQMPAFILQSQGKSDEAYQIMMNILISNVDAMHSTEIFYMRDYICNTLLKGRDDISRPPFCKEIGTQ